MLDGLGTSENGTEKMSLPPGRAGDTRCRTQRATRAVTCFEHVARDDEVVPARSVDIGHDDVEPRLRAPKKVIRVIEPRHGRSGVCRHIRTAQCRGRPLREREVGQRDSARRILCMRRAEQSRESGPFDPQPAHVGSRGPAQKASRGIGRRRQLRRNMNAAAGSRRPDQIGNDGAGESAAERTTQAALTIASANERVAAIGPERLGNCADARNDAHFTHGAGSAAPALLQSARMMPAMQLFRALARDVCKIVVVVMSGAVAAVARRAGPPRSEAGAAMRAGACGDSSAEAIPARTAYA